MIIEEQKYNAEVIKVIGIALIAPFGRAITDPYLLRDFGFLIVLIYMAYTLILLLLGVACILKGRDIIKEKKWN